MSSDLNPQAVSTLLDEARWIFEEEQSEGARLETRLAVLTGFAGLIMSLVAPTFGNPLNGVSGVFFDVFYVGSLALLALAALLPVSVLFSPGATWLSGGRAMRSGRADDELLDELGRGLGAESSMQIERRITATLVKGIGEQRIRNDLRGSRFRLAALALGAALLLIAVEAILVLFSF